MKDFLRKFKLLIEGKLPDYDEYLTVLNRKNELETEKAAREYHQSKKKITVPLVGFDSTSFEPTDTSARIGYLGQVDEFYEGILKDKLRGSIAEIRELLAGAVIDRSLPQNMTREQYDFLLRGMEAGLWKINDWAITLQGELRQKKDESI